jgi:prevent-host-death family protein
MKTIPISDLRGNLKQVLDMVKNGQAIDITQRGKIVATIAPPKTDNDEIAFHDRLAAYKNGGIIINEDIINAPLIEYDYINDIDLDDMSAAAEPNE